MKILIVSFYYSPEIGAAPSRITNMAEGLQAKGAEVDVLTSLPNYPKGRIFDNYRGCFHKKELLNGINIYRYWVLASVTKNPLIRLMGMFSFSLTMWAFAFKIKRIHSYDKVIIQSPPILVAFSAVILFGCLFKKNTVLNVSDLWPLSAIELGAIKEGSIYHKVMAWMERFIYRHSTMYQGQSDEIIQHIQAFVPKKKHFLYRNLQHSVSTNTSQGPRKPLKIVYAGLLGVAQDILGIVKQINFKELHAELHLYGGGNQTEDIKTFISGNDTGVFYHGYVEKQNMAQELAQYHASIVPLTVKIKGAVPSKIYDLLPVGIPILFCGEGEGADIIEKYGLGYVSNSGDFVALANNIRKIASLPEEEYKRIRMNCFTASSGDFSFEKQMEKYYYFLSNE